MVLTRPDSPLFVVLFTGYALAVEWKRFGSPRGLWVAGFVAAAPLAAWAKACGSPITATGLRGRSLAARPPTVVTIKPVEPSPELECARVAA